ncbi:MAG: hypothetical protein HXS41_03570 [Theionarchaea archaeon]|nr:hypothetical protein [Theionarchaea archaeon]MBU6999926.1 hypothetical protein [Theionarchaea archaeon]MBU7020117.1 hypothetical protein [Theionarchaea archaeon]MBU7035585.1 hypothetical protein [Theionarchaea archaeon]
MLKGEDTTMKNCPHCAALNSEKADFCWRCYKPLDSSSYEGFISLRQRIREKVRDIIQYRDIRELLREKIKLLAERESEERGELLTEGLPRSR